MERYRNESPAMKAYLLTTGTVFALVTVAHVWRMVAESSSLARDPGFLSITAITTGLAVWAWRLLRTSARS
jgi:hypothetical protein